MAVSIEEKAEFDALADQVRANGFMSLKTHADRNRYRELKDKIDKDQELMTVTRGDVQKMIDEGIKAAGKLKAEHESDIQEVRKLSEWKPYSAPKIGNPTAKLKIFREDGLSEAGLVIDWKYKNMEFNEETRRHDKPIYRITVQYDDGKKKEYDIELVRFAQINEYETVEIIKQDVQEQVMVSGKGQRSFTKGGYNYSAPGYFGVKQQAGGESFDLEVHRKEVNCVVKRANGNTLTLHVGRLNA